MEVAKTKYVWWDIDCCQVPRGRDPCEVRWIIESALNKKYGAGPVTIYAIGNMHRIPLRVLKNISRAGIFIKHTPYGGNHIVSDLVFWTLEHPPPAILMLISDRELWYLNDLEIKKAMGYTILRTYVNQKPRDSPKYASDVWLWKSLLTTDTKQQETTSHKDLEGETDLSCMQCLLVGLSFTDFTTHLTTKDHLQTQCEWFAAHPGVSVGPTDKDLDSLYSVKQSRPRKEMPHWTDESLASLAAILKEWIAAHPDASVEPTEKDVDSLFSQLMKHVVKQSRLGKLDKRKMVMHEDADSSQRVPTEKVVVTVKKQSNILKHKLKEWIAAHPDASVGLTDKDLDSLHSQLMKHAVKKLRLHKRFVHDKRKVSILASSSEDAVPTEKDLDSLHSQFMKDALKKLRLHKRFVHDERKVSILASSSEDAVPTEKDLGAVKKQSKPLNHKLKEPPHWTEESMASLLASLKGTPWAGPSEEGLPSLEASFVR